MSFCRIKFNKQTTRSQAHIKKDISPAKEQIKNNILLYIPYAPDTDVRVFNLLVDLSNKFKAVFVSHKQLALWSGFSVSTVRNSIKRLKEAGLVFTQSRGFKQTLYYKVAHHLFTPEVRYTLSHLLPALQFVALTLLFINNNCQSELLTPTKNSFFKNTNTTLQERNSSSVLRTKKRESVVKTERVMVAYGQNRPEKEELIPNYVKNLESIRLTTAGQVWLCAFPEDVIKKADKALLRADNVGSSFGYLMKTCIKIAASQNIKPNWTARFNLASELHVSDNDEMVESYDFEANQAKIKQLSKTFVKKELNGKSFKKNEASLRIHSPELIENLNRQSEEKEEMKRKLREERARKSLAEQIEQLKSEHAYNQLEKISDMGSRLYWDSFRYALINEKEQELYSNTEQLEIE